MAGLPEPFDDTTAPSDGFLDEAERALAGPIDDPIAAAGEVDAEELALQASEEEARKRLAAEQARRFAEDQARHEALHDPLTRLPNRALCLDRLGHALATTVWTRTSVAVLALAVELGRDGLGEERADELLKAVAGRLVDVVGSGDTVARLEGDSFAVVTEGVDHESEGIALAERLIGAFDHPFLLGGLPIPAQVSVGVVMTKDQCSLAATVLDEAEEGLARALERGPGRYELIDGAERSAALAVQRAEAELRLAVERGELRVFFQPLYTLDRGHPFGAEALIRWEHPQRGLLPPGEFLPLAEQSDLIADIGEWVLGEACDQAVGWPIPEDGKPLLLTVNLSTRQLAHPDLPHALRRVLARTGIDPARVGLEVSEEAFVQAPVGGDALVALKRMGVRLLLDDVDGDSSPLRDLDRFSFDDLKLDRLLIAALDEQDVVADATVESIVAEARGRGVGVIAEGVESITQLERLSQLGIALGQGYYFSRPLPATGMDALVRRANTPAVMLDHDW
jgi:diguanylate cyclase (GGDEF)-like protein